MAKMLGIYLGTTNSCMAVIAGGERLVIENSEGTCMTPSVVWINTSRQRGMASAKYYSQRVIEVEIEA
jgi:molecular chaperone DnaK